MKMKSIGAATLLLCTSTAFQLPMNRRFAKIETGGKSMMQMSSTATSNADTEEQVGAWLPVASVSAMGEDKESSLSIGPISIEIAGNDYVVWKNPITNEFSVLEDFCPHKLAPLSQGRIEPETGCIECPYHGWQFETDGALQCVPQMDEGGDIGSLGKKADARSLPVHRVGDMIFAFFPSSVHGEVWPQSKLPEEFCPLLLKEESWFTREVCS